MDASLVSEQDQAATFPTFSNTYSLHIVTLYCMAGSPWPSIGCNGTYFGKLLEILPKRAIVGGCKPSLVVVP